MPKAHALIRRIMMPDHFTKEGLVLFRAFKMRQVDYGVGLSVTGCAEEIVTPAKLDEYVAAWRAKTKSSLGCCVVAQECLNIPNLSLHHDPVENEPYGNSHHLLRNERDPEYILERGQQDQLALAANRNPADIRNITF